VTIAYGDLASAISDYYKELNKGRQFGVKEATAAWEEAKDEWSAEKRTKADIKGAAGSVTNKKGKVSLGTAAGREADKWLRGDVELASKRIQAMEDEGAGYQQIQKAAQSMYETIKSQAGQVGIKGAGLAEYITPESLIPPVVTTTIEADTTPAQSAAEGLKQLLTAMGEDPTSTDWQISADGSSMINETKGIIAEIDKETGNIQIQGNTTKAMEAADGAVTSINGKTGSLQIDANLAKAKEAIANWNPTKVVNIEGKTKKATGGPIIGPGGPTADKIPAMLSNGEWVAKASTVRKAGGFAGMAALTRAIDSGAIHAASGGGISKRTYKSSQLQNKSNPKDYVTARAQQSYVSNYNKTKLSVPVNIQNVASDIDVDRLLRQITNRVSEAYQMSLNG